MRLADNTETTIDGDIRMKDTNENLLFLQFVFNIRKNDLIFLRSKHQIRFQNDALIEQLHARII